MGSVYEWTLLTKLTASLPPSVKNAIAFYYIQVNFITRIKSAHGCVLLEVLSVVIDMILSYLSMCLLIKF